MKRRNFIQKSLTTAAGISLVPTALQAVDQNEPKNKPEILNAFLNK